MGRQSSRQQWAAFIHSGKKKPSTIAPSTTRTRFEGVILGVDPSLRGTGLAVIAVSGGDTFSCLRSETVTLARSASFPLCLARISERVEALLREFQPAAAAFEDSIFVQNQQTALILGAARGAALATVARTGIPIEGYPPLRIKQAVVGYGRASKEQVQKGLRAFLPQHEFASFDEADAAAVAICHAFTGGKIA